MTDTKRRIAITKRVDLSDLAEGWDGCYAIVTLASAQLVAEIADLDYKNMTNAAVLAKEVQIAKEHFVSGRIMVIDEGGKIVQDDMAVDDVEGSADLVERLFSNVVGVTLDPKDTPTAVTNSDESMSSESNTKTTS